MLIFRYVYPSNHALDTVIHAEVGVRRTINVIRDSFDSFGSFVFSLSSWTLHRRRRHPRAIVLRSARSILSFRANGIGTRCVGTRWAVWRTRVCFSCRLSPPLFSWVPPFRVCRGHFRLWNRNTGEWSEMELLRDHVIAFKAQVGMRQNRQLIFLKSGLNLRKW